MLLVLAGLTDGCTAN